MKLLGSARALLIVAALILFSSVALPQDADKQKLVEIEKAVAAWPAAGPQHAAAMKQYLYEGTISQLTILGRVGSVPKSRVVEFSGEPNPADPNARSAASISDIRVEIYGDTGVVIYKVTSTDIGHKDLALNATDHYGCLDTFVKRNGQWYLIANACSPAQPLPKAEWNALKKTMGQPPNDSQGAYN